MLQSAPIDKKDPMFICSMGCKRIHMRNSYQLACIADNRSVSIIVEDLEKCRKADVKDVLELMLLGLKQGQEVGFHILGKSDNIRLAREDIADVMRQD